MTKRNIGILQVILAGVCFGFLGIFGKQLFAAGLSVGEVLGFRFALAAALLGLGLLIFAPGHLKVTKKQLLLCAGQGMFGYALFASFYFKAIEGVSVPLAALLLFTYPTVIHLLAWALKLERLSKIQWLSLPVVMLGLILVLWGEIHIESWWAVAAGLMASLSYSIYVLVSSRQQQGISAWGANFYVMLFASVALFLAYQISPIRAAEFSLSTWGGIAGLALICTVAAMILFLAGLQKIPVAEASVISTSEPIAAVILSVLILQQQLNWQMVLGGALVILAILMNTLWRQHE